MGNNEAKQYEHLKRIDSPLQRAQSLRVTRSGLQINQTLTTKLMNKKTLDKMKSNPNISQDVVIIMNPPFSDVNRITDHLYLTGIAGLTEENITNLKITCIINATYEMPLLKIKGIESYRVPVDDDGEDEIILYFDDVSNLVHSTSKQGGKTIIHCMAGASRSSTLTIAYLIKFHDYDLKNAFCFLKSLRPCARPNIGFFSQLIAYEKYYRNKASVEIVEIVKKGKRIQIPDFYPKLFPDLYKAEIQRQLFASHLSEMKLQESNKNYINRTRKYVEINQDIQDLTKYN